MTTLNDFTKAELLAYAEQFGTDVKPTVNKAELIASLEEDGITASFIAEQESAKETEETLENDAAFLDSTPLEKSEEAPVEEEDVVLIRMIRSNPTYQVRGYTFRASHPFALVKESDADYLIEEHGGFRMASPKEAREFYG